MLFGVLCTALLGATAVQSATLATYQIQPGDTWEALAFQFQTSPETLQSLNPHPNPARQPAIGSTLFLPDEAIAQPGLLLHPNDALLLETAVSTATSPWAIALQNGFRSPYQPTLYRTVFIPGGAAPPRELPAGFATLEVSQLVGVPGQAIGLRGEIEREGVVTAVLGNNEMDVFSNDGYLVGLTGTGAFFGTQQPELSVQVGEAPPWRQPWQFRDPTSWEYQQLTLTGTAAQIDQESIAEERARLFAIWEQNSGPAQWQAAFQLPINSFLKSASTFGARRSYTQAVPHLPRGR
ncbi:MAG: LysM domain-containing protein [Chloroflexota bacterium]